MCTTRGTSLAIQPILASCYCYFLFINLLFHSFFTRPLQKRVTIMAKDMELVRRIRGERS